MTGSEVDQAIAAAVEAVGGGTSSSVERDVEGGADWQVEISMADGTTLEVGVDDSNAVVVVEPDAPESDDDDEPDDYDDVGR